MIDHPRPGFVDLFYLTFQEPKIEVHNGTYKANQSVPEMAIVLLDFTGTCTINYTMLCTIPLLAGGLEHFYFPLNIWDGIPNYHIFQLG